MRAVSLKRRVRGSAAGLAKIPRKRRETLARFMAREKTRATVSPGLPDGSRSALPIHRAVGINHDRWNDVCR